MRWPFSVEARQARLQTEPAPVMWSQVASGHHELMVDGWLQMKSRSSRKLAQRRLGQSRKVMKSVRARFRGRWRTAGSQCGIPNTWIVMGGLASLRVVEAVAAAVAAGRNHGVDSGEDHRKPRSKRATTIGAQLSWRSTDAFIEENVRRHCCSEWRCFEEDEASMSQLLTVGGCQFEGILSRLGDWGIARLLRENR